MMTLEEQLRSKINYVGEFLRTHLNSNNDYLPYLLSLAVGLILAVFTLNGFVELLEQLKENELGHFDDSVSEYVQGFRSSELTSLATGLTDFGDVFGYLTMIVLLSGFFFFRYRNWKFSLQVTTALLLAIIVNLVLKRWINRPRPAGDHLVEVMTLSFPSGHAMSAMAFYGFLVYLAWRYADRGWLKIALTLLCVSVILGIGISRIYLGVHYPSDIVAGYLGGLFWAAFCIVVFNVLSMIRKHQEGRRVIE